jgi:antitoxin (DNA-binding transcriptional repressor) of toxin-antitoxin stability system
MESEVTSDDAVQRFADLLERVTTRGESFVVTTNEGKPVCRIEPIRNGKHLTLGDWLSSVEKRAPLDEEYLQAVERVMNEQEVSVPRSPWDS